VFHCTVMGNACGKGSSDPESDRRHRDIEKSLREQRKADLNEVKILLLGAGDTGKSTLIKQIKLIYKEGFDEKEREIFRDIVATNILVWLHTLVQSALQNDAAAGPLRGGSFEAEFIDQLSDMDFYSEKGGRFGYLVTHVDEIKKLWEEKCIQDGYFHAHELQIGDSAKYFFENLDNICSESYRPSDQDILYARARTTGIAETTFTVQDHVFRVVDVGGQRTERRKWIHCFQDVTAILFFASLSEYNQQLWEERKVNRMQESLKLFDEIVNCAWFKDTAIILFLNKSDIFREKVKNYPLSDYYADYEGGDDFEAGCDYIKGLYLTLNENSNRTVIVHITCCTDTEQSRKVLESVRDVTFRAMMEKNFQI